MRQVDLPKEEVPGGPECNWCQAPTSVLDASSSGTVFLRIAFCFRCGIGTWADNWSGTARSSELKLARKSPLG